MVEQFHFSTAFGNWFMSFLNRTRSFGTETPEARGGRAENSFRALALIWTGEADN